MIRAGRKPRIPTAACAALAAILLLCPLSAVADGPQLKGTVIDDSGAAIAGADVSLTAGTYSQHRKTAADGSFVFDNLPVTSGTLTVSAPGFSAVQSAWSAGADLRIQLHPFVKSDEITVSASRVPNRLADSAASVSVLSQQDLLDSGAITLDDRLRQVHGFSLFRRSGSLAANPTTLGVSLRAVGATASSRALVLVDGVPLNDAFGGWVYWDRVPQLAIRDVEVLRGGASDLYGAQAMSGIINILPRQPGPSTLDVETFFGNTRNPDGSFFWTGQHGPMSLRASGEAFSTAGYFLLRPQDRGPVDTRASQLHRDAQLTVERVLANSGRMFLSGGMFAEDRNNGTELQVNNTHLDQLIAGADLISNSRGALNLRLYGESERYYQTFSAVAPDRASELLTRIQHVPSQRIGLSAIWTHSIAMHTLVFGLEAQDIRGISNEFGYSGGNPSVFQQNGGRQRFLGLFGEDILHLGPSWIVTGSLRFDAWRNFDALSQSTPLATGITTTTSLPPVRQNALSPRLSVLRRLNSDWSLTAAVYHSFRAPTLNELYRPFRVGNVLTVANSDLRAEHLTGGEAGLLGHINRRISLRGTFFWAVVDDPIVNVTIKTTPSLITQQRQNLGSTRSRGFEAEADARVSSRVTLSGGYTFADATVLDAANPVLIGNQLPQLPRNTFSVQAAYSGPRFTFATQGRYGGPQFEDDLNLLVLDPYFTLDASASCQVNRYVTLFVAVQNLLNDQYMVGRTPLVTLGPPLLARVGLRLHLSRR